MSSSGLPKFWTELTKIGHNFRKQNTLKIWTNQRGCQGCRPMKLKLSPSDSVKLNFSQRELKLPGRRDFCQIFFTEEKNQKHLVDFWCRKMTLKVQILRRLFIILEGLMITWYSEKMLIFKICRRGLMLNLIR